MTISLGSFYLSDGATVAEADEEATLPAANLLIATPFDRWRTLAATGHITFTYSPALSVSQVVLLYTNATASATWRVRAGTNTTTVTSEPSFDSDWISHQPGARDWSTWARTHALLDLGSAHSALAWRIDVDQVSGATYYEAGRVGFLDPVRSTRGLDWGDEIVPVDTSPTRRSRNGTVHVAAAGLYREVELALASTSATEFLETFGDLRRRVEHRAPIVYAKSPRADSLGNSPVGSIAMYTDDDIMDHLIYSVLSEPLYATNRERTVQRLRLRLSEVVHP